MPQANSIGARQHFFRCTVSRELHVPIHNALDLTPAILLYRRHLGTISPEAAWESASYCLDI